jgi:hypothetical protein
MLPSPSIRNGSLEEWVRIVRGEYEESPGLSLTREQAKRLWTFDAELCEAVLNSLMMSGFLRQNCRHMFVRNDGSR